MSITLILQDENKKTLGGYLWIFLILSMVITLHVANYDFTDFNSIKNFISSFLLLASFLSLAFITIRPEKWLNKRIFHFSIISPYFQIPKELSINRILNSPYIAKERDNFWGNFLIGFGFLIALLLPIDKVIQNEVSLFFEILKFFGCIIATTIITWNWVRYQREELRDQVEVIWRYYSIISQSGWKQAVGEEIRDLEDSLKLKIWEKAKIQIDDLNSLYENSLNRIFPYLYKFYRGLQFLNLTVTYDSRLKSFIKNKNKQLRNYDEEFLKEEIIPLKTSYQGFKEKFEHFIEVYRILRTLRVDLHNSEIERILRTRITQFSILDQKHSTYSVDLREPRNEIVKRIRNTEGLSENTKRYYEAVFENLDLMLFHIENVYVKPPEIDPALVDVSTGNDDDLKSTLNTKNQKEILGRFCQNERNYFEYHFFSIEPNTIPETWRILDQELAYVTDWIASLYFFNKEIHEY